MLAAFGLIGLLVVAILGVSAIAAFGLLKPVKKLHSTPQSGNSDCNTPEIEIQSV